MCNMYTYSPDIFLQGHKLSFEIYYSLVYDTVVWHIGTGVSSLDVEVACSSEMLTSIYKSTWRHIPENNLHSCCHENQTSYKLLLRVKHSIII
jgi:hypothetical protein